MQKTCLRCKKVYEYDNEEEKKKCFSKKGVYYQNVCIECTRKERKEKYDSGKYNYNAQRQEKYHEKKYKVNLPNSCVLTKIIDYDYDDYQ